MAHPAADRPYASAPTVFADRHIGPRADERDKMLATLGLGSLEDLVDAGAARGHPDAPAARTCRPRCRRPRRWPRCAASPPGTTRRRAMIGLGYHGTVTPSVIRRNVLEDPAWYTAYTPYQPEISQGRLEALLNFQTMVSDLTGLPTAGASLLDEATAVAEAMTVARRSTKTGRVLLLDAATLPQTIAVVRTRAEPLGIEVQLADDLTAALRETDAFAVVVQTPGGRRSARADRGAARLSPPRPTRRAPWSSPPATCSRSPSSPRPASGAPTSPSGRASASASRSSTAARTPRSCRSAPASSAPCPGASSASRRDVHGTAAFRLALQTREQHIRREKATSNICTAQVLLAVAASMYAVYHGPDGLRAIARAGARRHRRRSPPTSPRPSWRPTTRSFFDTLTVAVPGEAAEVVERARRAGVHLRLVDAGRVGISVGEDTTPADLDAVRAAFGIDHGSTDGTDRAAARTATCPPARARRRTCSTRCSAPTTARRRCCATCVRCRTATSRSTAA